MKKLIVKNMSRTLTDDEGRQYRLERNMEKPHENKYRFYTLGGYNFSPSLKKPETFFDLAEAIKEMVEEVEFISLGQQAYERCYGEGTWDQAPTSIKNIWDDAAHWASKLIEEEELNL